MSILLCIFLAVICLAGAGYFFVWAANNFFTGMTFEAMALSVLLVIAGITLLLTANRIKQTRRRRH